MADPRMVRWAKALTGYSVEVQPGQVVAISGGPAAEPLLREVHREVIERGGHPVTVPTVRGANAILSSARRTHTNHEQELIRQTASSYARTRASSRPSDRRPGTTARASTSRRSAPPEATARPRSSR